MGTVTGRLRVVALLLLCVGVATATTSDCPNGCNPNAGPPTAGVNGFLQPAPCACDWASNGMNSNLARLNSLSYTPRSDFNVLFYGADPTGVNDSAPAFQAAIAAIAAQTSKCGRITVPAGTYTINSSIDVAPIASGNNNCGSVLQCDGAGATTIQSNTVGTGFSMFKDTARTCTGGTGSCDARFKSAGRGAGCDCSVNGDCNSNVCATVGVSARQFAVRDCGWLAQKDNMIVLNLSYFSEGTIVNNLIRSTGTHQNLIGMLFSDGNATVAGYSNTMTGNTINTMDVCAMILPQANDQHFFGNRLGNNCGTGLSIGHPISHAAIVGNIFQSTQTPTCGGACSPSTCCGGFFHGKACTVGSDCGEADILDTGSDVSIIGNYIEDSANIHIRCGDSSSACPNCGVAQSTSLETIGNLHGGTGTTFSQQVFQCLTPLRLDGGLNNGNDETTSDFQIPFALMANGGPLVSMGNTSWWWQVHDTAGTVDNVGIEAPVQSTPGAAAAGLVTTSGQYVQLTTSTSAGSFAGWEPNGGTYNNTEFQARPAFAAQFVTGASNANVRYWAGLFSGDPSASATPALHYLALRYDSAVDGSTWHVCSDNASGAPTCLDTGRNLAATQRIEIVINTGTFNTSSVQTATFYMSDRQGSGRRPHYLANMGAITTKLPTSTQLLHAVVGATHLSGAAHTIGLGKVSVSFPN